MPSHPIRADKIVFSPHDIDLDRCPVRQSTGADTYVLGTFNPGLARLPNGNLLLMIRVAKALREPIRGRYFRMIHWNTERGYDIIEMPTQSLDTSDPRKYRFRSFSHAKIYGLTSSSWLLPVELSADGLHIHRIHYDHIILPQNSQQEYGIEDARITRIDDRYYMTVCSVSAERHSTMLYFSRDGLEYTYLGMILDHQNKDMVLFPQQIQGKYMALTRPLGELYFGYAESSPYLPGPSINLSQSPDLLHWKPVEQPFIRAKLDSRINLKLGGGAPPILTPDGWLILFHGVENNGKEGIYRTYWALLDRDNPGRILHLDESCPLLESNADLMAPYRDLFYLDDIVFTTGIIEDEDNYIVASGELDLCCRITHLRKDFYQG